MSTSWGFSLVPKGKKNIGSGSRFLFSAEHGSPVQGSTCRPRLRPGAGIDYGNSCAPVYRLGSQRKFVIIACQHGWPVYQLDARVAFLRRKISSEVYIKLIPGQEATYHKTGIPLVMKLRRSLCGLARSPVFWGATIDAELLGIGFSPTSTLSDPCTYRHGSGDTLEILTLHFGAIVIARRSE